MSSQRSLKPARNGVAAATPNFGRTCSQGATPPRGVALFFWLRSVRQGSLPRTARTTFADTRNLGVSRRFSIVPGDIPSTRCARRLRCEPPSGATVGAGEHRRCHVPGGRRLRSPLGTGRSHRSGSGCDQHGGRGAGSSEDRKLQAIASQTGATVDYDQFFSGLSSNADNGDIQMRLLFAGTLASAVMPGFGLAAGTLGTAETSRTS